ncbi:hypothetical protein F383_05018 [Gossypium arboreum]|uniref:Uncharacterized protein n=1 Tax=Gossypium arboreum TaxID=29729 RepID=A0A0B0PIN3_GOSAR|nr:hypothetical protein F383_05018 [Gossypium arboreum]
MFVALPSTVLCFIAINSNKKFLITVLFAETKKFWQTKLSMFAGPGLCM